VDLKEVGREDVDSIHYAVRCAYVLEFQRCIELKVTIQDF
jgi:hypothetical protein